MQPRLSWSDLKRSRVGVWGLGVEGRANLAVLDQLGADVVLVDDRPSGHTYGQRLVLATVTGGLDQLLRCDVVVKSPGISRYRSDAQNLTAAGVTLTGGLALWLAGAPLDRVIGVTGTKGKSTTTAIIGHLSTRLGRRCLTGGNLGTPPWDPAAPAGVDRWVIEISSYQAADLAVSPPVMAVTSLHPDHLDWHHTVERYYADKLSACSRPGAALTIAADSPELRAHEDLLGPQVRWVGAGDDTAWAGGLGLLGAHNRRNAAIARWCLEAVGEPAAARPDVLAAATEGFVPLPSRLQPVERVAGVDFVDDSLSTNVLPTIAAVEVFAGRRLALLLGGFDRGIDYSPLAGHLASRGAPTLVLTVPDNGAAIHEQLVWTGVGDQVAIHDTAGVADATRAGFEWARPDGVVLLSPAAPSFGRYHDYRDRAEEFVAAVFACRGIAADGGGSPAAGGSSAPDRGK